MSVRMSVKKIDKIHKDSELFNHSAILYIFVKISCINMIIKTFSTHNFMFLLKH